MVTGTKNSSSLNLGFLTILHEPQGYLGGYLVTNAWGRPLEFRLSTAVQPNRVQQILYGGTLQPFIFADLIGKTLMERSGTTVQLVITDREPVLELRLKQEAPVVWLAPGDDSLGQAMAAGKAGVLPAGNGLGPLICHPQFPEDAPRIRELLDKVDAALDLEEPFSRIREAMGEARKMGVTSRG